MKVAFTPLLFQEKLRFEIISISIASPLLIIFLLKNALMRTSFAASSQNITSVSTAQTTTSTTIVISYDLLTAAVVSFVLILLGLTAALLLMLRTQKDNQDSEA